MKAWTSEADLENVFMDDLAALGYGLHHGSEISPDASQPMRQSFRDTILEPVFLAGLERLNPALPNPYPTRTNPS
jgi:type I restriction enzyme R subunit